MNSNTKTFKNLRNDLDLTAATAATLNELRSLTYMNTEKTEKNTGISLYSTTISPTKNFSRKEVAYLSTVLNLCPNSGPSVSAQSATLLKPQQCTQPNTWKKTSKTKTHILRKNRIQNIQE